MKQTAQGLAALGRGPDTELVHMTPGEVKSLQQLAMANGGSLTINPTTGLPEAGFLSSMLPMLIGAGLVASGVGAPMAGLMVGGAQAARTGSLQKGLMAGFGAYGGGSLGAGLMGAGAGTAEAAAGALGVPGAATGAGSQAAMLAAQNQGFGQAGLEALGSGAGVASGATPIMQSGIQSMGAGAQGLLSEQGRNAFMQNIGGGKGLAMAGLAAASPMMETTTKQPDINPVDASMGQRYSYSPGATNPTPMPDVPGYGNQGQNFGKEQKYFYPQYNKISDEQAKTMYGFAVGGPVEAMSNANVIGTNTGYPMANIHTGAYATPYQQPISENVVTGSQDSAVNPYTGQMAFARGGETMSEGISHLGDYSDGGRLLRGPGDGVSDNIPAMIGKKQPARLADGEFVIPARIVSELGNGSTEAGARKLYAMMERVQKARGKTVGKNKVATNSRAEKHLPA
jgi:hypothetical protein